MSLLRVSLQESLIYVCYLPLIKLVLFPSFALPLVVFFIYVPLAPQCCLFHIAITLACIFHAANLSTKHLWFTWLLIHGCMVAGGFKVHAFWWFCSASGLFVCSSTAQTSSQGLVYVNPQLRVEKEERAQLQNQVEERSQRIQELLETLNASRESEVELEETFRQELAAQKKLTEVYQGV